MKKIRSTIAIISLAAFTFHPGLTAQETAKDSVGPGFTQPPTPRFSNYSVLPQAMMQPGFTTEPDPEMTVEIGGVGREPVEVKIVYLNNSILPDDDWQQENYFLKINPSRSLQQGLNKVGVEYEHPIDSKHPENPVGFTFHINYQPDPPPKITFTDGGALVVGGEPVFVLGTYRSGLTDHHLEAPWEPLQDAVESGFNMVHDYSFEGGAEVKDHEQLAVRIEKARIYLNRAEELGLGVFMGMPRNLIREYNQALLAEFISSLSHHPALWMWYIWDEPHLDSLCPVSAARTYQLLSHLDPNRPAIMLCNRIERTYVYAPFCDILWFDRYPFIATGPELNTIASVVATFRKSIEIVRGKKPVWPVLQLHDNRALPSFRDSELPGMIDDNTHRPSAREVRAQYHASIAAGANAVVTYHLPSRSFDMKSVPEHWGRVSRVNHDFRKLSPVFLSEEPQPQVEVIEGADKVISWSRTYEGRNYYGFVNLSVNTAVRTVVRPPSVEDFEVIEEDDKFSVLDFAWHPRQERAGFKKPEADGLTTIGDDGVLTIELPPAGVTVFSTKKQ